MVASHQTPMFCIQLFLLALLPLGATLNPPFFICVPVRQKNHHWVAAESQLQTSTSQLEGSIYIQLLIEKEMYCFIPRLHCKVLQGNTLKMGQNLEPFLSVETVTQIPVFVQRDSLGLNYKFAPRDFLRNSALISMEFLLCSNQVTV